jgi:hypothetical protein
MTKKKVNVLFVVIMIIALALFLGFVAMNITGFSISGNETLSGSFIDNLNIGAYSNMTIGWIPENACSGIDCSLAYLKVSGAIYANGSGSANIFIDNGVQRLKIAGKVFENGLDSYYLDGACEETCSLVGFANGNYTIIVEIEGAVNVDITNISYSWNTNYKGGGSLSAADKKTCPADGWYNSSDPYWVNVSKCAAELRQYQEFRQYGSPPHCNYNITQTNYSVLGYLNNDSDNDGSCDYEDLCGETVPWYARITLAPNHYDSSNWNASDTYGCSCGQILDLAPGDNQGEYNYGCSEGTVYVWMSKIGWVQDFWQKELRSWLLMPLGTNNQPQNMTFVVNAIAQCFASDCGIVNGTLLYNGTSTYPITIIPTSRTSKPFYVIGQNPQTCGQMNQGNVCNLTWIVNTTGAIGESYKIHATFNSSLKSVESSTTFYTIIKIIAPTLSIILSDDLMNVKFSSNLAPGSTNNSAVNNSGNGYSILCDYSPGRCNVSIRANGDMVDGAKKFLIGNASWNQANNFSGGKRLYYNYQIINATLMHMAKQYIYFWLDVPTGQISGDYKSNFTIEGLPN